MNIQCIQRVILPLLLAVLLPFSCSTHRTGPKEITKADRAGRLYATKCGSCHEAYPSHAYAAREWPRVLDGMQRYAPMTDEEKRCVLNWLLNND